MKSPDSSRCECGYDFDAPEQAHAAPRGDASSAEEPAAVDDPSGHEKGTPPLAIVAGAASFLVVFLVLNSIPQQNRLKLYPIIGIVVAAIFVFFYLKKPRR